MAFSPSASARVPKTLRKVAQSRLLSLLVGFMLTQRVARPDRVPQMAGIDWAEALADLFLHGVLRPPA